jgi:hypothetical protein
MRATQEGNDRVGRQQRMVGSGDEERKRGLAARGGLRHGSGDPLAGLQEADAHVRRQHRRDGFDILRHHADGTDRARQQRVRHALHHRHAGHRDQRLERLAAQGGQRVRPRPAAGEQQCGHASQDTISRPLARVA